MDCVSHMIPCSDPAAVGWLALAYLNFNLLRQVGWDFHSITLHVPLDIHDELVESLTIHRGFVIAAKAGDGVDVFPAPDWCSAWFFQFHLALRVKM